MINNYLNNDLQKKKSKILNLVFLIFCVLTTTRVYYLFYNFGKDLFPAINWTNEISTFMIIGSFIFNIIILILGSNITYFFISILNSNINEIKNFEVEKSLVKRICYLSFLIPLTLNSVFLTIYMMAFSKTQVPFNINTWITDICISFILFAFLNNRYNAKKVSIIISIGLFILNILFVFK